MSTATKSYAERYLEQVHAKEAVVKLIAAELAEERAKRRMADDEIVRFVLTRVYP